MYKANGTVQWYFSRLQSKVNENRTLDWLEEVWFMVELQTRLLWKQTKKKISAAQQRSENNNTMDKRKRHSSTWQKKKDITSFKLSLDRGINSTHEFLCTRDAICVNPTCMVVSVHAIFEGLEKEYWRATCLISHH